MDGALAQTYSPLQVILSDDCYTDHTFAIMMQMAKEYNGPHKIVLNRNQKNLGIGEHVNRVYQIAEGELIVNAAGDDISYPERVSELYMAYSKNDVTPNMVYSNAIAITSSGKIMNKLILEDQCDVYERRKNVLDGGRLPVLGCKIAVDRRMLKAFPPMNSDIMAEDVVLIWRAHLLNGVCYVPKVLVKYRVHNGGVSQEMINNKSRDQHLKFSLKWTEDRMLRYRQLYDDINIIGPENRLEMIKSIERLEQIEKRRLSVLMGSFFESLLGVVSEILVARGIRMHLVKSFLIRWFPYIIKYT